MNSVTEQCALMFFVRGTYLFSPLRDRTTEQIRSTVQVVVAVELVFIAWANVVDGGEGGMVVKIPRRPRDRQYHRIASI